MEVSRRHRTATTLRMHIESAAPFRPLKCESLEADLAIVGGGLAGCCAAVTAARLGLKVVLVHDRPVLGGNASSEVRLWVLGATCHMHGCNRWAREGGVLNELLVENMYRNHDGNPVIFDTVLLELVVSEPNITLLLNTAAIEVQKSSPATIGSVAAFCSQNSTRYEIAAPLFMDSSGDGIVGYLAGAAFRVGAESKEEFGEGFAPDAAFGELLGHSIYFYSKDAGHPVRFVAPAYALKDIEGRIPRYKDFNVHEFGCRLWWIEYGGRLDTVHDTEKIKWELWRVALGAWDYIKNSGKFPEAENLTLEWLGHIPGKRESRRFEGEYMLTQADVIGQREHPDAVAFGGWALDLHPADGVFSPMPGATHERARGIYQIPFRCLYSRNIDNLFLGGRLMSASHVAFGSTRVMGTLSHCGQAIAHAAAVCRERGILPRDCPTGEPLATIQRKLLRNGQHIPGFRLRDGEDLVQASTVSASSEQMLDDLPPDGGWHDLATKCWAQMLPAAVGSFPVITLTLDPAVPCEFEVQLRASDHGDNFVPNVILARQIVRLAAAGLQEAKIVFDVSIDRPRYVFLCLMGPAPVRVRASSRRLTGILSLTYPAVSGHQLQADRPELGIIGFEQWAPERRPGGENIALRAEPGFAAFAASNIANGLQRPTAHPNAWVAAFSDAQPTLTIRWREPRTIRRIEIFFDPDYDHPMESVLLGHPENEMPFCVRHYRLRDAQGRVIFEKWDNHQTRNTISLDSPVATEALHLDILAMCGAAAPAVFEVRCYGE